MQKLLFSFAIFLSAANGYCQKADDRSSVLLNTQPNWERLLKNRPIAKSPKNKGDFFQQSSILITSDTARYSHRSYKGNVYILPQDNMPCLVPDKQVAAAIPNLPSEKYLPNASFPNSNSMPNALDQRQLIFEQPAQPVKK